MFRYRRIVVYISHHRRRANRLRSNVAMHIATRVHFSFAQLMYGLSTKTTATFTAARQQAHARTDTVT